MTAYLREFSRAAISALVAAAPAAIAMRLVPNSKPAFVLGFLASVLLFFIVLLTNYYGLRGGSAVGHVTVAYLQLIVESIPIVGLLIDVRPKRYRWEAKRYDVPEPEPTLEEDRRDKIAVWSGSIGGILIGALAAAFVVPSADLPTAYKIFAALYFLIGGFMAGIFTAGAIAVAWGSGRKIRFVVGSAVYGAAFGAILLSGFSHKSIWFPAASSITFTFLGLFTAWLGMEIAKQKGYDIE